jgi:hypothetical protein
MGIDLPPSTSTYGMRIVQPELQKIVLHKPRVPQYKKPELQNLATLVFRLGKSPQGTFLKSKLVGSNFIVYSKCPKQLVAQSWVVAKSEQK